MCSQWLFTIFSKHRIRVDFLKDKKWWYHLIIRIESAGFSILVLRSFWPTTTTSSLLFILTKDIASNTSKSLIVRIERSCFGILFLRSSRSAATTAIPSFLFVFTEYVPTNTSKCLIIRIKCASFCILLLRSFWPTSTATSFLLVFTENITTDTSQCLNLLSTDNFTVRRNSKWTARLGAVKLRFF